MCIRDRRLGLSKAKKPALHNEITAAHLLHKIVKFSKEKFLLVLDDFHYLRPDDPGDSYLSDLSSLMSMLANTLNSNKLRVVLTLDGRAKQKRIELAKAAGGVPMLRLNEIVELEPFGIANLIELIDKRLTTFKWSGKRKDFIDDSALALLIIGTNGNARAIVRVLKKVMDEIYATKSNYPITAARVLNSVERTTHKKIDEEDAKIIQFIAENNGAYGSQSSFKKAVGLAGSNINSRCKQLVKLGILQSKNTRIAKTTRVVYKLAGTNGD